MSGGFTESDAEEAALGWLESLGYTLRHGPGIAFNVDGGERTDPGYRDTILQNRIAGAQAQLQTAEINLGYTEIRAPIDGKISSTSVTEGNVVSPTSGTLASLVSQDPMYVIFAIAQRTGIDLRNRYGSKGGLSQASSGSGGCTS